MKITFSLGPFTISGDLENLSIGKYLTASKKSVKKSIVRKPKQLKS